MTNQILNSSRADGKCCNTALLYAPLLLNYMLFSDITDVIYTIYFYVF